MSFQQENMLFGQSNLIVVLVQQVMPLPVQQVPRGVHQVTL